MPESPGAQVGRQWGHRGGRGGHTDEGPGQQAGGAEREPEGDAGAHTPRQDVGRHGHRRGGGARPGLRGRPRPTPPPPLIP